VVPPSAGTGSVSATAPAAAALGVDSLPFAGGAWGAGAIGTLGARGALGLSAFCGANAKNRPTSIATVTARYKTFRMTFLADLD
jgi:hypothetical protein